MLRWCKPAGNILQHNVFGPYKPPSRCTEKRSVTRPGPSLASAASTRFRPVFGNLFLARSYPSFWSSTLHFCRMPKNLQKNFNNGSVTPVLQKVRFTLAAYKKMISFSAADWKEALRWTPTPPDHRLDHLLRFRKPILLGPHLPFFFQPWTLQQRGSFFLDCLCKYPPFVTVLS